MEVLSENVNVRYEYSCGVHQFETTDGQAVAAVSQATWEAFIDSLRHFEAPAGSVVLSPELITSPYHLSQLSARTEEVRRHVAKVQSVSSRSADVTYLLGTASFEDGAFASPKPHNSLAMIRNGVQLAMVHKRVLGGFEGEIFRSARDT